MRRAELQRLPQRKSEMVPPLSYAACEVGASVLATAMMGHGGIVARTTLSRGFACVCALGPSQHVARVAIGHVVSHRASFDHALAKEDLRFDPGAGTRERGRMVEVFSVNGNGINVGTPIQTLTVSPR